MSDVHIDTPRIAPKYTRCKISMTSTYPSSSGVLPFLRNPAQKETPEVDVYGITRSALFDGTEQVVSHEGTSQYNKDGSGTAACGLAALNFARVAFLKEQGGLRNGALVQTVLSRECAEVSNITPQPSIASYPQETAAVCTLWSGNLHLEVADICRVPIFEKTLELKSTIVGHPGFHFFKSLLM